MASVFTVRILMFLLLCGYIELSTGSLSNTTSYSLSLQTSNIHGTTTERVRHEITTSDRSSTCVIVSQESLVTHTNVSNNSDGNDLYHNTTDLQMFELSTKRNVSHILQNDPWKQIYDKVAYYQDVYIIPIICPVSIVGNTIVGTALFSKGKGSSFIYLISLLIADNLSLVTDLFLPVSIILKSIGTREYNRIAANIHFWSMDILGFIFRGTALNIICVLSIERLMVISRTITYKSSVTVKQPKFFVVLAFVVSFCCHFSTALFIRIKAYEIPSQNSTVYKHGYTDLYAAFSVEFGNLVLALQFFAGPFPIALYCAVNVSTIHYLHKFRKENQACHDSIKGQVIKNAEVKLCKILFVLSLVNLFAFLPNSVTTIIAKGFPELGLSAKSYFTLLLLYGGNILRIINSGIDCVVMICMSRDIRNNILKICRLSYGNKNDHSI